MSPESVAVTWMPHFFRSAVDLPGVAADVVLAEDVDGELGSSSGCVVQADHVLEHAVVGDVVAGGLGDALVALAGEPEDIDAEFLLGLAAHGVDVVADEPDRTGRVDADGLGLEDAVGFADGRRPASSLRRR